jgi:cytochrome P450
VRSRIINETNVSANALSYAFYLLALHFDVQEKLHAEVQKVCGNRVPLLEDMPNMTYSLCVMYETMRLFPVLGTVANRTEKDEILLGKHLILKNTSIGPDMVSLHRNEKYWGDTCNEFNPSRLDNRNYMSKANGNDDRWFTMADDKIRIPVKGAFWPFGEGPRACLGNSWLEIF